MKIKKNKSKEKETNNDVPSTFSFFWPPFIIFLCFFSREIKMRCVCVGGNERERESIENLLLFFFYLLQYVFFKERWKRRCVCGSGDGKELEKCGEYIFFGPFSYDRQYKSTLWVMITIVVLIVINNIRKKLVMITTHYGIKS